MMSITQVDALLQRVLQRPIAYHRAFAEIGGGACAGLMLSQAWYWTPRAKMAGGWFYKTAKEWESETGLTVNEQKTARRRLRERGLIEEDLRGIPAKVHYRVDRARLIELLAQHDESQTSSVESDKLDEAEASNLNEEKPRSITETTTETRTEITSSSRVSPRGERGGGDNQESKKDTMSASSCITTLELRSPEAMRMAERLRELIPFPDNAKERASLDRLCRSVSEGTYPAEEVLECAQWMLTSLDLVCVAPSTIERWLPTFMSKKRNGALQPRRNGYKSKSEVMTAHWNDPAADDLLLYD